MTKYNNTRTHRISSPKSAKKTYKLTGTKIASHYWDEQEIFSGVLLYLSSDVIGSLDIAWISRSSWMDRGAGDLRHSVVGDVDAKCDVRAVRTLPGKVIANLPPVSSFLFLKFWNSVLFLLISQSVGVVSLVPGNKRRAWLACVLFLLERTVTFNCWSQKLVVTNHSR